MRRNRYRASRKTQKGITLVLVSLVLLILLGAAGFGIDLNHQVLNKTRLQNAVDFAALASAVVADDRAEAVNLTERLTLAEQAANDALTHFAASDGNQELVYTQENISVTFSNDNQTFVDADSFTLGSDSDIYIRVAVSDVPLTQYLSFIFGFDKAVSASAVAGPSAPVTKTCNVSPIAMCGDVASADLAWGYIPAEYPDYNAIEDKISDTIHVLKPSSHEDSDFGAGNYHLLDFDTGKNTVRDMLAGSFDECLSEGDIVTTEPGKATGPVAQGLNTRFDGGGTTDDGEEIKSDKYLEESNVTYENYKSEYENETSNAFYYADYVANLAACEGKGGSGVCSPEYYRPEPEGQADRRVLSVPIVRCEESGESGGKIDLEVLGLGCFFVTQQVQQKGNESEIFGQFLEDCTVKNASTGIDPDEDDIGPYKIVLYKDPLSGGS